MGILSSTTKTKRSYENIIIIIIIIKSFIQQNKLGFPSHSYKFYINRLFTTIIKYRYTQLMSRDVDYQNT